MRTVPSLALAVALSLALPAAGLASFVSADEIPAPETEKPTPAPKKVVVYQLTATGKG